MAFRRSVTTRAKFFYQQQQRLAVPLSHIDRHDNDDRRRQSYLCRLDNSSGSSNLFRDRRFSIPAAYAPVFVRNMSSRGEAIGTEIMNHDAADLLGENTVEAVVAPVANQVAAAAIDFFPADAVVYTIDYLHSFTGMNWWASIAVTTILIRTILLPLEILHMKATTKFTLKWRDMQETTSDMSAAECLKREIILFLKSCPVLAITTFVVASQLAFSIVALFNLASKLESFKDGGAFWFTDLTTPDPIFILPLLTAFTFWREMESYAKSFPQSNPDNERMYKSFRVVAATLAMPFAASLPKAILCFWITSNLYSLTCGKVIQVPEVKMMLGLPDIAVLRQTQPPIPTIDKCLPMALLACLATTKTFGFSI